MHGVEAYKLYYALKFHFTTYYDFFKYRGKTRFTGKTYDSKPEQKYLFERIASKTDPKGFILANLLKDPKTWPGSLSDTVYIQWKKRQDNLTRVFQEDIKELDRDFNANFKLEDSNGGTLLKLYFKEKVSIETLIILDRLLDFFSSWDEVLKDNIMWEDEYFKFRKYSPFVEIDKEKFRKILIEEFNGR